MNLCIVQARMDSSRLPGKVLRDIAGVPMLARVVERAALASTLDQVVVATTRDPSDDAVAGFCMQRDIPFSRGSSHDVLDRFVQTARRRQADVVVRVTADCPLLDPQLVDQTVSLLLTGTDERGRLRRGEEQPAAQYSDAHESPPDRPGGPPPTPHGARLHFSTNRLPEPWGRSYPIGLDVEAVTLEALERAWAETDEKGHREHVLPYLYDDLPPGPLAHARVYVTPRGFRLAQLHHAEDLGGVRWTVDTPEDLQAVTALAHLLPEAFTWLDALHIWQEHPEIGRLNARVPHRTSQDVDERG